MQLWKIPLGLVLLFAAACTDDGSNDAGGRDAGGDASNMDATNGGDDADAGDDDADASDDDADASGDGGPAMTGDFIRRTVASGLSQPFEMAWGPDDHLWITERTGKRVTRVHPVTGEMRTLLQIDDVLVTEGTQDGLLGLALHPELMENRGNDFVYLSYTYDINPDPGEEAIERRTRIVRFTYDPQTETLGMPQTLIEGLAGSNDHNSGRVVFGPDGKIYYSIGELGNNQLGNYCEPIRAQRLPTAAEVAAEDWWASYQGKILRMNLDGSIPADNPFINGVQSHIYSYGHRNAQGLTFGSNGLLYETEHGPKTDDELNIIQAGRNYGWPRVAGFKDDKAYVYGNWSESTNPPCEQLTYSNFEIPDSVPQMTESSFNDPLFTEPLQTFFTVENDHNFMDPLCAEGMLYFICWPTIAPSSIAIYEGDAIPGLKNTALITTLKHGTLYVLPLNEAGTAVAGEMRPLFTTTNRYRDVLIGPDQKRLFLATDSAGLGRNAETLAPTMELEDPGVIFEFEYRPGGSPD